ncbi:hypothetical protein PIB30_001805 [Stylosanthes scabra]|uniref:Uncharacterized protein n=1 Tax=Stylosanthes scabra TaxID=79078 RepID=A0ABU6W662_9FABA|nr:hypothetical protein [Stylosanthes scabra]
MQIVQTPHISSHTKEYSDWCVGLADDDARGVDLPDDVPPAATQPRDNIVLPQDAPTRGRRARQHRPDVRRKGKGVASSSQVHEHRGTEDVDEEAEHGPHEETLPKGVGDHGGAHDTGNSPEIDFFSGADAELARWALQGEGLGSRSGQHSNAGRSSGFEVAGPTADMYEMFTCGDQMIDPLAQEFVSARDAAQPVYQPESPIQPHYDPVQQVQGFQYYQPSPQTFQQPLPHQQHMHLSPQPGSFHQFSPQQHYQQYMHYSPLSPCGTSSHLHHRPDDDSDRA